MRNDNHPKTDEYMAVAEAITAVLDTKFLTALSDSTRVLIIKRLIQIGGCDISTIAQGLTQDRSVISRHLAILERAGITQSRKIGRQVFYDIDGPFVVAKVSTILSEIQPMREQCKPFLSLEGNDQNKSGAA